MALLDDHAKNFSFVCDNGVWHLAPAYDLTRSTQGYNGEHATSVNNNGNPTREDMVAVGKSIRIPRARTAELIDQVESNLMDLKDFWK